MMYKKFFLAMFVLVLLSAALMFVTPIFVGVWQATPTGLSIGRMGILLGIMVIAKLISIVLILMRERFAKDFNKRNFFQMLKQFLNMRYDEMLEKGATNIIERIVMSVNSIYAYLTGDYIFIWSAIIVILVCFLFVANISLTIALVLLTMLPINFFGYKLLNKELARRSQRMQKNTGEGFQEILSIVGQVDYLKQSSNHHNIIKQLSPSVEKIYGSMASVNQFAKTMSALLDGVNEIAKNASLIFIIFTLMNEHLSPYDLLLFTIIVPIYFSALSTIVNSNVNRNDYKIALSLQNDLEECEEEQGGIYLESIETIDLDVKQVVVANQSIPFSAKATLRKGDIVKVAGISGSGKSSFAKALVKLRNIEGVSINDIPLSLIKNGDVRNRIEYLPQNAPIIKASLLENLFFNMEYDEKIERVFLDDPMLKSLFSNKTITTNILEGGANLSGGEKQKIALARALSKDVDVLILDEVSNNIDTNSTKEIYNKINAVRTNYITFIITHESIPEGLANIEINAKG